MNASPVPATPLRVISPVRWGTFLLGFALAGFFDGILLHQILQWHHLLSGLESAGVASIGAQILADGVFHGVMYGVAVGGLCLLFRHRRAVAQTSGPALVGHALIGFGAWQVLDVVLNHWVLGLHRVRMDTPNPLLWDIAWILIFGVAVLVAGYIVLMRKPPRGPSTGGAAGASVAVLVVVSAIANIAPVVPGAAPAAGGASQVTLLTLAGNGARTAFDFAERHGGAIVDASNDGTVWLVSLPDGAGRVPKFTGSAWVVASGGWGGCASWIAAK